MFKIGTLADWFGVGLIEGIRQSQICGATGVQIYAWNELDPQKVTLQQVELIKKTARDCGQEITALCAELGGHGLELKEGTEEKLDYLRKTVELARELNCGIITTHIGIIPEDPGCDTYQRMQESCRQIGDFAKERGAVIAVETGPEPVKRLCSFLDGRPCTCHCRNRELHPLSRRRNQQPRNPVPPPCHHPGRRHINQGDYLLAPPKTSRIYYGTSPWHHPEIPIIQAQLGNNAGIIGAALLGHF